MAGFIELTAADGHKFAAYEAKPKGAPRGAVVVAPEIFGVNAHIRAVADGYAADGYLAIAPALFDRTQRDYETGYSPDEVQASIVVMQKVSMDDALKDVAACVVTLPSFPGSLNRAFTRPAFAGRQAMPVRTSSG